MPQCTFREPRVRCSSPISDSWAPVMPKGALPDAPVKPAANVDVRRRGPSILESDGAKHTLVPSTLEVIEVRMITEGGFFHVSNQPHVRSAVGAVVGSPAEPLREAADLSGLCRRVRSRSHRSLEVWLEVRWPQTRSYSLSSILPLAYTRAWLGMSECSMRSRPGC